MSVNATYISTNSFSVIGDLASNFDPGRAILAYHGTYGAKLVYADYCSYDAITGLTTVNTIQTESENLSSDLTAIDYSSVKPDTVGLGNIPNEVLYLYRGLRKFMYIQYSGVTSILINNGYIHVHDGIKDKILWLPGDVTKTQSFNISSWYYVYVTVPSNDSLIITSDNISLSTTVPTLDYLRCGYYNGASRCIGFFLTDGSGNISYFYMNNVMFYCILGVHHEYTVTTSWYLSVVFDAPLGNLCCHWQTGFGDTNTATVTGQMKEVEDPDETTYVLNKYSGYSERMHSSMFMFLDANKKVYMKNSASQVNKLSFNSFLLPFGLSGQC